MKSAIRAAAVIAIFSILSKILGAARVAVFANRLGAGQEMDIYVAAFRLPDLIFNLLILGTLSAAFLPVFVDFLKKDHPHAFRIASTIFSFTLIVMSGMSLLGFIFAPFIVRLIVPGFDQQSQAVTVQLTRIMMLSPLLFSISSVLTGLLHSFKKFAVAAIAPLFYNISIIFGVFFLYPRFGLTGLAWGVVLGAGLHLIFQLPAALNLGFRPFAVFDIRDEGVKKIAKLFLPRIFGVELGQISLLVASVLASFQASGSLAIFYYAYDLETIPLGIFAVAFAIASFPVLSELYGKQDLAGFRNFFSTTAVQVLFLMIPISVLTLLLRAQIVRLVLGLGENTQFSFADTRLTAQALGFFALSMFAQALVPLLARGFYATQNTLIPVLSGFVAAGINIVLAVIFTKSAGPDTMALAFSIAIFFHMLIMLLLLHKRIGGFEDEMLFVRTLKISVASVVMGIFVFVTLYLVAPLVNMQTYLGILIQTLSALAVGVGVYLGVGKLIQIPESQHVVGVLKSWFFKFSRPVTSAIINMFTDVD